MRNGLIWPRFLPALHYGYGSPIFNYCGPISLYPAFALSGLARYEGTQFPTEFRDNLFTAQHHSRAVGRHVLVPDGSTFRAKDIPFVTTDDPDFQPNPGLATGHSLLGLWVEER